LGSYLDGLSYGKYRKWAQENKFESRLPGDIKKRKAGEEQVTRTLDRDLREKKPSERVVEYTDKLFRRVAVEWLVAADQASQRVPGIMGSLIISSFSQYKPRTSQISGND
jgi:hypothetical protein